MGKGSIVKDVIKGGAKILKGESKGAAKVGEDLGKSAVKSGDDVGKAVVKEAEQDAAAVGKAAASSGETAVMANIGTAAKGAGTSLVEKALQHWKITTIAGAALTARALDTNVFDVTGRGAMEVLNIQARPGEGRWHAILRSLIDTGTQKGQLDQLEAKGSEIITKASNSAHGIVDKSRSAVRGVAGSVSDRAASLSAGGGEGGGIGNALANLFSNGLGGLNIGAALMLPLAWFTFGKFGWLGKVGALAMLMYGISNLFNGRSQTQQMLPEPAVGGGRKLPTAKDNYDAVERQQQAIGNDDLYNVRAQR